MIVRGDGFGADAQDQINSGIHCREIIVICGFSGVPAAGGPGRFRIRESKRREIFRAFRRHPVKRAWSHFGDVFKFRPEKSGTEGPKKPLVTGGNHKVGAELIYVQGDCATTLANIEKQQSALRMARSRETRGIQQHAIIEADQAYRNETSAWRQRGNEIIRGEKTIAWGDYF